MKLPGAARSMRCQVERVRCESLLYQDALSAQDECVVVPLYLVSETIRREGRRSVRGCRIRRDLNRYGRKRGYEEAAKT